MQHIWQDCSRLLETELTPQQFSAWIKPLKALDFDESTATLTIGAPNRLKLDAIRSQFSDRIAQAASRIAQRPVAIVFAVDGASALAAAMRFPNGEVTGDGPAAEPGPVVDGSAANTEQFERSRLNPNLTFDTFVTGKANQLARAAAMQVAENPGGSYNPLFLYGGVGLGKTHLIHAVGNAILARKPGAKVRYIHAEQYVSDVVRAYQRKAFDDFKRYYHSLDLLLID
ncbi:MAG: DnaA ATPase domain-containing protein, partial [Betaproteobacteria bacterium]